MKKLKYILIAGIALFLMQSCDKDKYSDPTRMEDYLVAPEYTPDWTETFSNLNDWSKLENDGEVFFPYYYQITGKPTSMIYRTNTGIKFVSVDQGWDQRCIREGFDVNGDFEIEFKGRIVQGTGNAVWQKGGIIVGDIGADPAKLWLSLENPIEAANARVCRFISGAPVEWKWDIDHHNFSQYEWQIVKAVRIGNTLTIYRNGVQVYTETGAYVTTINGKVGLSTEQLSFEYEYIMVNGVKDDFSDLDKADMGNWSNLDQKQTETAPPSVWTIDDGLNISSLAGWHHRAVKNVVDANFTAEIKLKLNSSISAYPKVGLMVGDLGGGVPALLVGIDNNSDVNDGNAIVKFLNGWANIVPPNINIKQWNVIRITRIDDSIFIYFNENRIYYEKGSHITAISGMLGILSEGCDADIEYISYKAFLDNKPTYIKKQEVFDLFDDKSNFVFYHNIKNIENYASEMELNY